MQKSNIKIIGGKYRGKKLYMNDKEKQEVLKTF
jgi:16S rRNA G966 N2-methylase RsmD